METNKNINSMNYELGVLLYNLKNTISGTFPAEYNAEENFLSLISGIEKETNQPFNFEKLQDGFVSESQNYNSDPSQVANEFSELISQLKENWIPFTPEQIKIFIVMHYINEKGVVMKSFWNVHDAVNEAFALQEASKQMGTISNSVFTIVTSYIQ